jgi:hypothetical protein
MKSQLRLILFFTMVSSLSWPAIRLSAGPPTAQDGPEVSWTTPSRNSSGSMPLGNGDISVNAWTEQDGDLLLDIGKTDSWDENCRLLKLGRLRLHFTHTPLAAGKPFRQVLRTGIGAIEIAAGQYGGELRVRLGVDANRPVSRFKLHAPQQTVVECVYRGGKVESLRVTPETRRKDVEVINAASTPQLDREIMRGNR